MVSARLGDVTGLRPLWTIDDLELDRLALLERPETVSLNRREVDEHIAAAVTFDEPVTFGVVEPLDLACDTHRTFPALQFATLPRRLDTCPVPFHRELSGHKKRPRVRGLGFRRLGEPKRRRHGSFAGSSKSIKRRI